MPLYFFNTRIGHDLIADPDGTELRDADQAWEMARSTIRHLLKSENGKPNLLGAILEVTDIGGEILLEFPFSEALLETEPPLATRH